MTKKDYELIARVISSEVGETEAGSEEANTIQSIIGRFMYELQHENPRFDVDKFRDACHSKPWYAGSEV